MSGKRYPEPEYFNLQEPRYLRPYELEYPFPEEPKQEEDIALAKKESHKEVERRRRAMINEGISSLANIIPGNEKNKGKILQKTVEYIHLLKEQIQDGALEKSYFEKAYSRLTRIADYSLEIEHLKRENEQLKAMLEQDTTKRRRLN